MTDEVGDEILKRVAAGDLHAWLVELTRSGTDEQRDSAYAAVLRMHSDGELNLLGLLLGPQNSWELGPDYQARAQLYENLLARIGTDAASLVGAIGAITSIVWQYSLDEAFRRWCEGSAGRPDEVLRLAGGELPLEDRFLLPALVAGYKAEPRRFLEISFDIAQGRRGESQSGAIFALGAMPLAEGPDTMEALQVLADLVIPAATEDRMRATILFAAIRIVARAKEKHVDIASRIAASVADDPTPDVLAHCAMAIASHGGNLPLVVRTLLARAFWHLGSSSPDALNQVDLALAQMLRLGDEEEVVEYVQWLLSSRSHNVTFATLDSVVHELSHGDRTRLGRVIVRWLATGDAALCAAARHLVFQSGDQRLACAGDFCDNDWSDELRVFIAKKAIGWLMPHATAPASILVALLGKAGEVAGKCLASLLVDPLLVNYPLATRSYLEEASKGLAERSARWVTEALSVHAKYLQDIEQIGAIRELQPSRRHRQLGLRHQQAEMNASMRKARAESPLLSMVSRQLILYGARTICRVTDFDGTERRLVNEMKSITSTTDRLMGLTYDIVALELQLVDFRHEAKP